MSDCQTAVFRLIAESPLPLTTNNIIQHLDYGEDAIRKSISNLRRKNLIESTGYRHFLTLTGKTIYREDPTLANLNSMIGSYVRQLAKPKTQFMGYLIDECEKTEFGRRVLSNIENAKINSAAATAVAPFVAFFAIHAGLINVSRNYEGASTDKPEVTDKMNGVLEALEAAANAIKNANNFSPNGN